MEYDEGHNKKMIFFLLPLLPLLLLLFLDEKVTFLANHIIYSPVPLDPESYHASRLAIQADVRVLRDLIDISVEQYGNELDDG